ncbi:uncharacterized protein LOC131033673 isoform X3 [Cryptomeria japonica]|uniref:uncharacterized protein LOC131033673 isoform X3 n=1 Tax=Cryptomeria japonica TaxID=3369 RepID=UPI0027DA51FF|nr:uncharacterized protein LOC131033673 isoform X3 [Cryptomeria japonica]
MRIEVARGKGRRAGMEVEQEQGLVRAETGKVAAELDKPVVAVVLKPKKGRPRKGKEPMLEQGQQIRLDHGQGLELGKEELEGVGGQRDGESCVNNDKSNGASCSSQSAESLDSPVKGLPPVKGPTGGPQRRSSKGGWTEEEDEILRRAVQCYNGKNWKRIAQYFPNRTDVQCLHRWQKVINPNLIKGPWTKEEDNKIVELVHKYGVKKWSFISQFLPGRIGKQCRERTDNAIKNHWNSSAKRKVPSYLASGLLTELPDLASFDLSLVSYSGVEEASTPVHAAVPVMEERSNFNSGSSCKDHNLSGSVDRALSTEQPGQKRSDMHKETWKFANRLDNLFNSTISPSSKADSTMLLKSERVLPFTSHPMPEPSVCASSYRTSEFSEIGTIGTGNGCYISSHRKRTGAVKISGKVAPLSAAECRTSTSYACQPSRCMEPDLSPSTICTSNVAIHGLMINMQEMRTGNFPSGASAVNGIGALDMKSTCCLVQEKSPNSNSSRYELPKLCNGAASFITSDAVSAPGCTCQACSLFDAQQMEISSNNSIRFCPSRSINEKEPEVVLRNAAKSFTSTPSILRKRPRYASASLQIANNEKKAGNLKESESFCSSNGLVASQDEQLKNCSNENNVSGVSLLSNGKDTGITQANCIKKWSSSVVKLAENQVGCPELSEHIECGKGDGILIHTVRDLDPHKEQTNGEIMRENEIEVLALLNGDALNKTEKPTPLQNLQTSEVLEQNLKGQKYCCTGEEKAVKIGFLNDSMMSSSPLSRTEVDVSDKSVEVEVDLEHTPSNLCGNKDSGAAMMTSMTQTSMTTISSSAVDHVFNNNSQNGISDLDKCSGRRAFTHRRTMKKHDLVRDKANFDSDLGSPIISKSSTCDTSLLVQMCSSNPVIEETGLSVEVEEKLNGVMQSMGHLNDYASSRYKETEKDLSAEHENESNCKRNLFISLQNLDGEDPTQAVYQLVTKAKAKVEILEAENAELTATLKALKEQLSSYDGLILYPTYSKKLAAYPVSQQPMLELAMKANFYKSRHEIQQKTKAAMAVATGRPIDKSEEDSSQMQ